MQPRREKRRTGLSAHATDDNNNNNNNNKSFGDVVYKSSFLRLLSFSSRRAYMLLSNYVQTLVTGSSGEEERNCGWSTMYIHVYRPIRLHMDMRKTDRFGLCFSLSLYVYVCVCLRVIFSACIVRCTVRLRILFFLVDLSICSFPLLSSILYQRCFW